MARKKNGEAVYTAAERFVDAALRHDDSLFTPGQPIWTQVNVNGLYEKLAGRFQMLGLQFDGELKKLIRKSVCVKDFETAFEKG